MVGLISAAVNNNDLSSAKHPPQGFSVKSVRP
jgi:hypothetical protein